MCEQTGHLKNVCMQKGCLLAKYPACAVRAGKVSCVGVHIYIYLYVTRYEKIDHLQDFSKI